MKTLFVLPNAIGDIISALGVAHKLKDEGEVIWTVSPNAAATIPFLEQEGFTCSELPIRKIRRMNDWNAPTETMRRTTTDYLESLQKSGPFDRVINLHLTRSASLLSGSVDAAQYLGPAINESRIHGDPWSDFILSSIHFGVLPYIDVPTRYSLIAGLTKTAQPNFKSIQYKPHDHLIVFQPSGGWKSKTLSAKKAAAIADELAANGNVVITGSPSEEDYLADIRSNMSETSLPFTPGPLRRCIELIAQASCVVTTDTWTLHTAAALGTPFVSLLGPTRTFTQGSGIGVSNDEEPSWSANNDQSLEALNLSDIKIAFQHLMDKKEITGLELANSVLWSYEDTYPQPIRPLSCTGKLSEKQLFSWARFIAFANLVKENSCGTTL
ncbi:MAG: hypothetical protein JKX97_08160, partial [Candidatus Lindowbacteria bacterium]|nr:hypothetical protein [Candidatus Lindowbacteria bacterium]